MRPIRTGWTRLAAVVLLVAATLVSPTAMVPATAEAAGVTAAEPTARPVSASSHRQRLQIGFNGTAGQVAYSPYFYGDHNQYGSRLCQAYVGWDITVRDGDGLRHPAALAGHQEWLRTAQTARCQEVLVAFKAKSSEDQPGDFSETPPTVDQYRQALRSYLGTDWRSTTGFTGRFALAPWNEPNLNGGSANGFSSSAAVSVIAPRLAARYYLAASQLCRHQRCTVVAANFASNAGKDVDFFTNCADIDGPADRLCSHRASVARSAEPSYLDSYRNEIVVSARSFGLGRGFRPPVLAYHGWADSNRYLRGESSCTDYGNCVIRRVIYATGGSWRHARIWNTEDGIGQPGFFQASAITDDVQADAMAFDLRLTTLSPRYTRLYYTHLVGSDASPSIDPSRLIITDGTGADQYVVEFRPALCVLQHRARSYDPQRCPARTR